MSDDLNGGTPADDTALFSSVVDSQPQPVPEVVTEPAPVVQQPDPQNPQPSTANPEPAIPPSRLREEADARRRAEGEVAELRGRLSAMEQRLNQPQPQTKQEPKAKRDIWDDPDGFVQDAVMPLQERFQQTLNAIAKEAAVARFTEETVNAAEKAFMEAARARTLDPADFDRVANAPNRYSAAVAWHKDQMVRQEVGTDPAAYRTRVLEEALKDPAFQARVIEAARGQAQANGNMIAQPARAQVQSLPSLNKVGAVALPENGNEASDAELFASTTRRRTG